MIIKAAHLNEEGCETLLRFVADPSLMCVEDECVGQSYLPGISVPYYPGLARPFNLPLRGDYEPLSTSVDWPRMGSDSPYLKRATLMGMLVAESVTSGPVIDDEELADLDDMRRLFTPTAEEKALDEAFDEFTLEHGGLFKASVAMTEFSQEGSVEFICFENLAELERVRSVLKSGRATLAEVIGAVLLLNFESISRLSIPRLVQAELS